MQTEYEILRPTRTFLDIEIPSRRKPISSEWVFTWKLHEFGDVIKRKCGVASREFREEPGVDYNETFSGTLQASSVRLLMTIVLRKYMELLYYDAERANRSAFVILESLSYTRVGEESSNYQEHAKQIFSYPKGKVEDLDLVNTSLLRPLESVLLVTS